MGGAIALAFANAGARCAWIVPTYRNGRPLWRYASSAVGHLRKAKLVTTNQSERIIEFSQSRGLLGVFSADNEDSIRGEAFHLVILDEAARIKPGVWEDVVQPTLADYGGRAYLISTPKGRNWFYHAYQAAQRTEGMACWQAPSAMNPNPRIKAAYLLAQERVPERTFLQEWDAKFIEDAGLVFRRVRDAATAPWQEAAQEGHQYLLGVDWGKSADFTVITVLDVTTRALVYYERFNQIDYQVQLGRLRGVVRRFQPESIIAEQNSMGDPLIELLRREELPVVAFTTTNATKANAIEALVLAFEQGDVTILNDETLIDELQAYTMDRLPSGMVRYSAPPGQHDDMVMSLALAWHGVASIEQWEFV